MKKLFLLRHAKSDWGSPHLKDHDRPLNKRGLKDAPKMGRYLKKIGFSTDLFYSSTALRAKETSLDVAKELEIAPSIIQFKADLYQFEYLPYLKFIKALPDTASSVLIVGHNPTLEELCSFLIIDNKLMEISTCTFLEIELNVNSWSTIRPSIGKLTHTMSPKQF